MYKYYGRDVIVILVGTAFVGFFILGPIQEYLLRPGVRGTMAYRYKDDKEKIAYRHYTNYTDSQSGYTATVAYKNNYTENSDHSTANVSTEKCDLKRRQFMPEGSMPVIILLSFPGSGNTWVRYLIERASGIYSGSVYQGAGTGVTMLEMTTLAIVVQSVALSIPTIADLLYFDIPMVSNKVYRIFACSISCEATFRRSELCSRTTIVVKVHKYERMITNRCIPDGAVLLIRNPYNAMLAEFNRREAGKTGLAPDKAFNKPEWERFVRNGCRNWSKTYVKHIDVLFKRLVVFYEDLVQDTSRELRRMLDFLHAPQNETRLQCLFRELDGPYKREHKRGLKQSPFNEAMNATVDGTIRDMRRIMEGYGITLPTYESRSPGRQTM